MVPNRIGCSGFLNVQYFTLFASIPVGVVAAVYRVFLSMVAGLWLMPRVDVSPISRRFESLDSGYCAYVSMLHVELQVSHPVLLLFCAEIADAEGRRRMRKNIRWWLVVTLINNPQLLAYRKGRLQRLAAAGKRDSRALTAKV